MDVLPTCASMHHVCAVHMETRYSGTVVTDDCSHHVGVGNWIQILCKKPSLQFQEEGFGCISLS